MTTPIRAPGCEHIDPARAIRQSGLKLYARSAHHCFREQYAPETERIERSSKAMDQGSLSHCLVLEPGEFLRRFRVEPADGSRSSLKGAEALIRFYGSLVGWDGEIPEGLPPRKVLLAQLEAAVPAGISIVTADMLGRSKALHGAVWSKTRAAAILSTPGLLTEQQLIWMDADTDAPCQGTLDILIPPCDAYPGGLILDLKKTVDASPEGFIGGLEGLPAGRWSWCQVSKLRMHWQADHYSRGVMACYVTTTPPVYGWIAVEDPATPQTCGLYVAAPWMLELARKEYAPIMEAMYDSLVWDTWPGYSDDFQCPAAPAWYGKNKED